MLKRLLLNPFILYSLIWLFVIILYSFNWSSLYGSLDANLFLFLILTSFISILFGIIYDSFIKRSKHQYNYNNKRSLKVVIGILLGFLLDFIYAGFIPLISELTNGELTYKDFEGIPTFHVLLVTFSLFYACYCFYSFLFEKKKLYRKRNFLYFILICICLLTLYNRFVLISVVCVCVLLCVFKSQKISKKLIILILFVGIIALYLFGILGNLRSGSAWNNADYIKMIAHINNNYPSFVSDQFLWSYVYFISPLGNLNSYIINYNFTPDIYGFLTCLIPDFISKRLLPAYSQQITLVSPFLTVSTGFAGAYKFGGFIGMYILYFILSCVVLLFGKISQYRTNSFVMTTAFLDLIMIFMFFDNMLTFSGISFVLVYTICLTFKKPTNIRMELKVYGRN